MLTRFVVGDIGIYEAVDRDCPRNDSRRENKPDGSWLPKVGIKFPNAISFWKNHGLQKYEVSGLKAWHESVAKGPIEVIELQAHQVDVVYEDEFQVIGRLKSQKVD